MESRRLAGTDRTPRQANRRHLDLLRATEAKARKMEEEFVGEDELRLFEASSATPSPEP